jgi:hypothetical protein
VKLSKRSAKPDCQCASLRGGIYRFYDFPDGADSFFVDVTPSWGEREYIAKCEQCGQLWHHDTVPSGHMDIEAWDKIEDRDAIDFIQAREAEKQAEAAEDAAIEARDAQKETRTPKPPSFALRLLDWLAKAAILIGCATTFLGAVYWDEGKIDSTVLIVGGIILGAGIALSVFVDRKKR